MTDLTVAGQEQCQAPACLEGSSSREGTGAMWKLKVTLSFSADRKSWQSLNKRQVWDSGLWQC